MNINIKRILKAQRDRERLDRPSDWLPLFDKYISAQGQTDMLAKHKLIWIVSQGWHHTL